MGFDVLNVIQTPTSSSGGSSGGTSGVGEINPKILNSLKDYQNLMENVSMKATGIRDKIMEWLGFTKHVNKLTGEISWELGDSNSKVYKIWGWIKKIFEYIVAYKILKKIYNIWQALKNIQSLKLFGTWGVTAIKLIAETFVLWFRKTKNVFTALGETGAQLQYLLTPMQKVVAVVGAAIAVFKIMTDTTKDLATGAEFSIGKIVGIGAALGGIATAITLLTGPAGLIAVVGAAALGVLKGALDASLELKQELANSTFFDGMGVSASVAHEKLKTLTGSVVEYAEKQNSMASTMGEWNDTLDQTTNSLDIMLAQFGSESFEITKSSIDELDNKLKNLKDAASGASQAFTDYITNSTLNLKDQGIISKETADAVVNAAIRKQQAEGKYYDAYITKINDLKTQLKDGKISQEEYNEKVAEAKKELDKNTTSIEKTKVQLNLLTTKMQAKIKLRNWEEAKKLVQDITDEYTAQKKSIQDNYDSQYKYYEELKASAKKDLENAEAKLEKMKETDKGYKDQQAEVEKLKTNLNGVIETQDKLTSEQSQNLAKINRLYSETTSTISQQVKDAGAAIDENGRAVLDDLTTLTNTMADDLTDAAQLVASNAKDMTESVNSQTPYYNIKSNIDAVKKDVKSLPQGFTIKGQLKILKSVLAPRGIDMASLTKDLFNNLRTSGLTIQKYAQGGFPDVGQMFLARESGPELVGNIGNKSAVVNNSQIVEAVSRGVAQAVSGVMSAVNSRNGGDYNFYFDGQQILDVIVERINREQNITGRSVFANG